MQKIGLAHKLRYRFDEVMARGPIALILWLSILSLAMIVLITGIVSLGHLAPVDDDGHDPAFVEIFWMGLMRTLDPGTMGGDRGSWSFLIAMLAVTLGGIFVVSTLIGVLTSGIEGKLDEIRKGRSVVVENNHTVILGWSPHIYTILSELSLSNANKPGACVVILAEKDKTEMDDDIRAHVQTKMKIVCRTGSPIDFSDLSIVNVNASRAIIVLASEGEDPDSHSIKTCLAILNNPERRPEPYHITVEVRKDQNMEIFALIGKDEIIPLLVPDVISRIIIQTCRQPGLSVVYTELLAFEGDDIYIHLQPDLVGKTVKDALFFFDTSTVIGLVFADGRVAVKPPLTTVIKPGDRLIVISRDDDTIIPSSLEYIPIQKELIRIGQRTKAPIERTLILGWNRRGLTMMGELDAYVAEGSEIVIVTANESPKAEILEAAADLKNLSTRVEIADSSSRKVLDRLDLGVFDHIITLSYIDDMGLHEADAKSLITLLHLRDIASKKNLQLPIVSEMLDVKNRELAEVTKANDFIVSEKLISLMVSQISESPELAQVFGVLFDPEGADIYVKPAKDYIETGIAVNFFTIVESASQKNEIALGYRIVAEAQDAKRSYGVYLNPTKQNEITLGVDDKIIVLAEK